MIGVRDKFTRHNTGERLLFCCLLTAVLVLVSVLEGNIRMVKAYDNVVIVIDPGHGGEVTEGNEASNAGAMYHDLMEKDINLITAKSLKSELEKYGNTEVYLTRTEDVQMSLDERVAFAKSVNADILVSVHYNASSDHNLFGSEIFVSAFGECYATGRALAECVMGKWEDYGNIRKDIKTRIGQTGADYYGIIRLGTKENIPTIILEHGYLDNDKDYLRIKNQEAWEELGKKDAEGIAAYYGLEKDLVRASVTPTITFDVPTEPVMPDTTEPYGVNLVIDNYDSDTGDIAFSLYAYDDESKLMYYGFVKDSADADTVFPELELWTGKDGLLKGTYHVTPGYEGNITATVFNTYQLNGISNTVSLKASVAAEEEDDLSEVEAAITTDDTVIVDENGYTKSEAADDKTPDGKKVADKTSDDKNSDGAEAEKSNSLFDKMVVDSIERNTESTVRSSYIKLILVGLIMAMVIVVSIVLSISSASKRRRRNKKSRVNKRGRTSYDWIDDDYRM